MLVVFGSDADEVDDYAYRASRNGEEVESVCTPRGLAIVLEKHAAVPLTVVLIDGTGEHRLEYRAAPGRCEFGRVEQAETD